MRSPQLRRGGPRRRTGGGALSSGECPSHRRWGSGNLLCSCERMLAGAGREIAGCPPSSDGSSEVQTLRSPQLRRGNPHRGWTRSKYPALHEPSAAKQKAPLARALCLRPRRPLIRSLSMLLRWLGPGRKGIGSSEQAIRIFLLFSVWCLQTTRPLKAVSQCHPVASMAFPTVSVRR